MINQKKTYFLQIQVSKSLDAIFNPLSYVRSYSSSCLNLVLADLVGFGGVTHNNLCGLITVPTLASGSLYPPFVLSSIIYTLPAGLHPVV